MRFEGMFKNGDKLVSVMFDPGWGDPGQYNIQSTKYGYLTADYVYPLDVQAGQANFLTRYVDEYKPKVIEQNWSRCMTDGDVALYVIDALDMDDKLFFEYLNSVRETQAEFSMAFSNFGLIADRMNIDKAESSIKTLEQKLKTWKNLENTFGVLVQAYDIGSAYGLGWSNETFVRDFPDHPLADLAREEINARSQQDSTTGQ